MGPCAGAHFLPSFLLLDFTTLTLACMIHPNTKYNERPGAAIWVRMGNNSGSRIKLGKCVPRYYLEDDVNTPSLLSYEAAMGYQTLVN